MQGRRNMGVRKELTQSLKHTGMLNYQEAKKLGSSVDKFQKEFEKKLRDLSVQQSILIASQRKRDSRRGSLPSSPSLELYREEEKKKTSDEAALKSSFSDSAIDQCTSVGNTTVKDLKPGANTDNSASSSLPLKLPRIFNNHQEKGSRKIELEDVQSLVTPDDSIFDKLKYSRQAKPRVDALDMTRKLSNGYSAMITASPPTTSRSTRRGSIQVSPLATEEPVSNQRRLIRRGSCPTLGARWRAAGKAVLDLKTNGESLDDQRASSFSRHVEEMKKCRYLRFPNSIREDEEEDIDSILTDK